MLYFKSTFDEGRKFLLLPGKDYVVGRRDCDIAIEYDQSVSRKHAILSVSYSEASVSNVNIRPLLTLKDVSKFGTYVNNQKIKGEQTLHEGDEVRFGTPKSVHIVLYEPFIVSTSCLNVEAKKVLRSVMCQLGGHISSDWRKDCRALVMKSVTVTIKVVCALVSLKPVVTVDYLRDLLSFSQGKRKEEPKAEDYLPPVAESLVEPSVSFQVNAKRASVFQGMIFYFLSSKQFQTMHTAVEEGGGVPLLWDNPQQHGDDMEAFLESRTVVMNPAVSDLAQQADRDWVEKVSVYLSSKDKFMVQNAEIGYAALYASTDTFCNADKDVSHLLPGTMTLQSMHTQSASLSSPIASTQATGTQVKPAVEKTQRERTQAKLAFPQHECKDGLSDPAFKKPKGKGGQLDPAFQNSKSKEGQADAALHTAQCAAATATRRCAETGGSCPADSEPQDAHWGSAKGQDEKESKVIPVPESLTHAAGVRVKTEPCHEDDVRPNYAATFHRNTQHVSQSQDGKRKKAVVVKVEDTCTHGAEPSDSCLPDADMLSAVKKEEGDDRNEREDRRDRSDIGDRKDRNDRGERRDRNDSGDRRDRKAVILFEDDEDDIVQTKKAPPSKNKRRIQTASDDEENPFDFVSKKRPKKVDSPVPESPHLVGPEPSGQQRASSTASREHLVCPVAKAQQSDIEVVCDSLDEEDNSPFESDVSRKSTSHDPPAFSKKQGTKLQCPAPAPRKEMVNRRSPEAHGAVPEHQASPTRLQDCEQRHSQLPGIEKATTVSSPQNVPASRAKPAVQGTTGSEGSGEKAVRQQAAALSEAGTKDLFSAPVPEGFLTTRKDQVPANPLFQKENSDTPAMVVTFKDLVCRPSRISTTASEDQSDVPQGMMKWGGRLVPNFKLFTKTKHAGIDQLPKIIGGRDLEEHCRSSSKLMDDWLRDLSQAESQQQQREQEAQRLFDIQPDLRGRKARR